MTTNHHDLTAAERHPVPRYEFASLGAAESYTYSLGDVSCMVRVGTNPAAHYMITEVNAGVGTLERVESEPITFGTTAGTACEGNDSRLISTADYASIWVPRVAPAAPHADDNEFLNSIADLTTWDPGAYQTRTLITAQKTLQISGTGNGSARWGGVYKAIPASEFSVVTEVGYHAVDEATGECGLMLMQGNSATDDIRTLWVGNNSGTSLPRIISQTRSAYNGGASATASMDTPAAWLRMRVNGTTCASDWSYDGNTWIRLSSVVLGFTPVYVGVGISATRNATVTTGRFSCLRFASGAGSSAFDALLPGRLMRMPIA